jgi:methionyl-tRNA formyltransferase
MRIVFMGSPDFALPALRRLIESAQAGVHEIVGVYTQPDRPVGRGRKPGPPPVKTLALAHGLSVLQPDSISKPDAVEQMRALHPDVGVIAAYGQILRQRVLDVPPLGILNVHASLLPRWRGAAPIPAAILAGDTETGATIMRVVRELDAGPMLASVHVPIGAEDNTALLTPKVAEAGAALLIDVLPKWQSGSIEAMPQDDALATYAPQIKKTDALINWDRDDAETIARQVRAYNPWPMAFSYLDGEPLRILEARAIDARYEAAAGTFVRAGTEPPLAVVAASGAVLISRMQPAGGRAMDPAAFLRGRGDVLGKRLTSVAGASGA